MAQSETISTTSNALANAADLDRMFFAIAALCSVALAGFTGAALLQLRSHYREVRRQLEADLAEARLEADSAERLLNGDGQLTLLLKRGAARSLTGAKLFGSLKLGDDVLDESLSTNAAKLMDFEQWLEPDAAIDVAEALSDLRETGQSFKWAAHTLSGGLVEISGRNAGNELMMRFRALADAQREYSELKVKYLKTIREIDSLRNLFQSTEMPVWMRDENGRLTWVNAAYARAVETNSADDALDKGLELLDSEARNRIIKEHQTAPVSVGRMSATLAGQRRTLDVIDTRSKRGSAGMATDVTAIVEAENKLELLQQFHARTLDQLHTPVAVFNSDQRLVFYNSAYQQLWGLDPGYLDGEPLETEILDQLRTRRLLQEQSDFASWRSRFLEHYQSLEPVHNWWHLPDGHSLQVVTTPHPHGGITQIFEDFTERLDLESQLKRLSQVREETLDHLSEGVAVFASDGRMQLSNPAFMQIWSLDKANLTAGEHISAVAECAIEGNEGWNIAEAWNDITLAITEVKDRRDSGAGQIVCDDERIVDYSLVPLPDGLTMLTFVDVTDSVQVKQALMDRNQALEAADAIKSTFIKHVSYALRAPLTNIIGFAELLAEPMIGPLNDKQSEYVDHILTSSSSLMAIINDVLDLATVEAGIVELDLGEVDVQETVDAVIDASQDRLNAANIQLVKDIPDSIGGFIGDAKRVRQVLFNVLSNAIRFSDQNGRIEINARPESGSLVLEVVDNGPGIPDSYRDRALKPFESTAPDAGRRNVGLGLSIVEKFMELHQGSVDIRSDEGNGTTVLCRFPIQPEPVTEAAE